MAHVRIFLSTVSAEFRSYRDALRPDLDRPNVTVKVQEDFIATGTETLDKLDDYICECDAVIHLVGDMTGAMAQPSSLAAIRQRYPNLAGRLPALAPFLELDAPALSYTQWEAWLALYHGKVLIIAAPQEGAPRDERYTLDEDQRAAQQAHLQRLKSVGRYPEFTFANADRLAVGVMRSALLDILVAAGLVKRPVNLPNLSIGALFKGRESKLAELEASLGPVLESNTAPAIACVLDGLGGVGKTRLALEYAWRRAGDYAAKLFVGADSPEALQRNVAALCGPTILDLPEQAETDEVRQYEAVLAWLCQHPGWLLILDNIDSEDDAEAVEALLPKITGGHVLLTSRLTNWSASVLAVPLHALSPEAAVEFLLARTDAKRRGQPDDPATARTLADELGCLALALEQAGAHIAKDRLSFARYLEKWQQQRDKVLAWFDPRLMQYPSPVAITWQTSFDRLGESARRLLQRLAWLAPEGVPESLLEVPVPGLEPAEVDPFDDLRKTSFDRLGELARRLLQRLAWMAPERVPESLLEVPVPGIEFAKADPYDDLSELEAYSLIARAGDTPSISVHRLVQEVSRLRQRDDPARAVLAETLKWIDAALVGDPNDVRDWPVLEPLAPHAQAVAMHADAAGIAGPTSRLLGKVGLLLFTKAQHAEAEPLMRRALAIDEQNFGSEHPRVAIDINNLAQLLQSTNRLAEAEPLMRRALAINQQSLGPDHPEVATDLNNLAGLLLDTNRLAEAEPLMRRALAVDEKSVGPDHPSVATHLNNLAQLLQETNRLAEAEPLMRRALAIDEQSFGPDHPIVASHLNNLAGLLLDTNRLAAGVRQFSPKKRGFLRGHFSVSAGFRPIF